MSGTVLAVDLGGTRFRAGVASVDDPASVAAVGEWPAPRDRQSFLTLVSEQLASAGADHLGVGVPGLARGTICTWIPNLPYLNGLDLVQVFPGTQVAVGNDAHFALVAEASAGAAVGIDDALLLAIGTGIGSAVLAGGRIVAGSSGAAASFGWASVSMEDNGNDVSGWLERHASGRALDSIAATLGLADGVALIAAARGGDTGAIAAIEPSMRALGVALAGAVALLDPAVIIIAGGLVGSLDVVGPMVLAALRGQLPRHLRGIDIRAGRFGARAGLVGAAFAGSRGAQWRQRHG